MRTMLKSKIHRATVTDTNIDYEGSLTIDPVLMKAADILPYEQVHVLNLNNGQRFTTYAIEGRSGSGEICVNGAAARLVSKNDIVIILSYSLVNEKDLASHSPKVVHVDAHNKVSHIRVPEGV